MTVKEVAEKIAEIHGRLFLVGGAVRDRFMNREIHDRDFVVTGVSVSDFKRVFDNPPMTGKSFPVFRIEIDGEECEVAFARREKKVSEGHNGFVMEFTPSIDIKDDLIRRDVTCNAMACDVLTGEIIDLFGGREAIQNKVISAVSEHFMEDPLRVLRVARQAACFDFKVDDKTLDMMFKCKGELKTLPFSRIWKEMEKALMSEHPEVFFQVLRDSNTMEDIIPELEEVPEVTGDNLEVRFCSVFKNVSSDVIKKWDSERFPKKLKKAAIAISKTVGKKINNAEDILDVFSEIHRNCEIDTFITITGNKVITKKMFDRVFEKINFEKIDIELPDDVTEIKRIVREIRLERIKGEMK